MSQTKAVPQHSKFANSVLGLLVVANGFLMVGFANSSKDGVKNYFKRTFAASPDSYGPVQNNDIINEVQEYMSGLSKENREVKSAFVPETIFELAQTYKDKAERTTDLKAKARNYSLALLELEKLPKKDPRVVKQVKPVQQHIRAVLQSISSVGIGFGDKREKIELLHGLADKVELSDRYYPIGSISYLIYDKAGLKFGLRNNRVFAINIRSNFRGVAGGIQIGYGIDNIKTLYQGKVHDYPGNNFAYQCENSENRQLTFVFSDQDELVDGIKIFDRKFYGSWSTALR